VSEYANIAAAVSTMAAQQPDVPAIYFPGPRGADGQRSYSQFTYAELDRESDLIAAGLNALGIEKGTRAALMVKPSLEFFALTFGIFKAGAVPVMIDPGIGLKNLKTCLGEAAPDAFIGIPPAHVARLVLGWARDSIRTVITVGRRWFWGGYTLEQVRDAAQPDWQRPHTTVDDLAAILFTSGSTGVPKGVEYTHRTFLAQVELIRDMYSIKPGEIDLPTFPLFALFDPALGMTTVIPHMDFTKPASIDPAEVFEPVKRFGVTNMFGSPALLRTVGRAAEGQSLPSLQRVISAGAPVPATVMESVLRALPDTARVHTPYGATECLPVCSISSAEVLGETREATDAGLGVCVGAPIPATVVRVIRISDDAIPTWSDDLVLPQGEIGEIVVKGEMVTRSYFRRDEATRLAKIREGDAVWHRMGDLGRFDEAGRVWFCGRKAHRVILPERTMFTVPIEARFNTHPAVYRSALVGARLAGGITPVLCIEREPDVPGTDAELLADLRERAATDPELNIITHFLMHSGFPVDIRHNAKINRETLAVWATGKL
jgi:acyl-CoA synthetase (AMP-forming)/AMP-acid ligase II